MKGKKWKHAADRWLYEKSEKKSLGTDKGMLAWIEPHWKESLLSDLTADRIRTLAEIKRSETSGSTANRYLALVKAILRTSTKWGWLERVPPIDLYSVSNRRIRWLTKDEAQALIDVLPEDLRPVAAFALSTGLRRANVLGLEWSQVDIVRRVAWIHGTQSKSGKPIGVPLNETALDIIGRQKGIHETLVFPDREGKRRKRIDHKVWKKSLQAAGIEDFRWHDLRHTWASWHLQGGTPIHVLQELGGWHSYAMVHRYAHLATEHLLPWAENAAFRLR